MHDTHHACANLSAKNEHNRANDAHWAVFVWIDSTTDGTDSTEQRILRQGGWRQSFPRLVRTALQARRKCLLKMSAYSFGRTVIFTLSRLGKPSADQKPILICVPAGTLLAVKVCEPELVKLPTANGYAMLIES